MLTACSSAWPLTSLCICALQEFKNVDGEEYHADMSTLASTASQGSPDVYILPLTEVSLPVAKQPARSGESLSAAAQSNNLFSSDGSSSGSINCIETSLCAAKHKKNQQKCESFQSEKIWLKFWGNRNETNHDLTIFLICSSASIQKHNAGVETILQGKIKYSSG